MEDRWCFLVARCAVALRSRPAGAASAGGAEASRGVQSISNIGGIQRASPWCVTARDALGAPVVQRSECRSCRHAAVAYRSLVGEMWERGAVCSLLLLFVQRLQLVSMISHELARWVWWCLQLLLPPLLLPDSSLGGIIGPVGLSASCRFGIFSGVLYNLSNVFDDHDSNSQVDRCFRALKLQYATGRAIVVGGWPD